jgi:MacB-like periplasmic core domain
VTTNDLVQDVRYGVRSLAKAPAFATAAIAALALGIGATTAIFSVVNAVVLAPLPYADPDRLVSLWEVNHEKNLDHEPVSPVNFMDYRTLTLVFADAAAWWRPEVTLRNQDQEPIRVSTVEVSGNFLTVVGVRPALGAGFPPDVFYSRDRLVLMSHRLWESRFSSDMAIVGKSIRLNDDQFTVAGVMPRGVRLSRRHGSLGAFELQTQLFNVKPSDPATLAAVVAFIGTVALGACFLPAHRATRVDHDGGAQGRVGSGLRAQGSRLRQNLRPLTRRSCLSPEP